MGKEQLGVFINPAARRTAQEWGRTIAELYHCPIYPIPSEELDFAHLPERVIIVGGEYSLRRVVERMYRSDELRPVGVVGGGTHDVARTLLVNRGLVLSPDEFMSMRNGTFLPQYSYRPGEFDGKIFNNHVGTGVYERTVGEANRLLAFLPRRVSSDLARYASLLLMIHSTGGKDTLNIYSVSPNIGSLKVFPKQDFHGSLLTHASIEDQSAANRIIKLLLTLTFWRLGWLPPQTILRTESAERFNLVLDGESLWIDGDTERNQHKEGEMVVGRKKEAIVLAAIVPKVCINK